MRAWLLALGVVVGVSVVAVACSPTRTGGDDDDSSGSTGSGSSSGVVGPRPGEPGSPCARNAECDSSLCLASGRCTKACSTQTDCPTAWGCSSLPGAGLVCQCALTSSEETCDGVDNDCNARVDDGATCANGLLCQAGACVCPPERTCGGACVDTQTDEQHCGGCSRPCGANNECVAGACVLSCGALTACSNMCVNTQTDPNHCGMCGRSCGTGGSCNNGTCTCGGGLTLCSSACVDTQTSTAHCGMCGRSCNGGQTCVAGMCMGGGTSSSSSSGGSGGCTNTCMYANDGACDDGGPGAEFAVCALGTDCTDCGPRSGGTSSSSSGGMATNRPLGDPCTADSQCAGGFCIRESNNGWPGGYCSKPCTVFGNECGEEGTCREELQNPVCFKKCGFGSDCREPDYTCEDQYRPFGGFSRQCFPAATGTGAVGDACTGYQDCGGGRYGDCLVAGAGFPGGYCTRDCSLSFPCPSGSHCGQYDSDGAGICLKDCGNCRGGYSCTNTDAQTTNNNECWPN